MGSRTGVLKAAAKRIGISYEEYLSKRQQGFRWCCTCKSWRPLDEFGRDKNRWDGICRSCFSCRRQGDHGTRKRVQAAASPKPEFDTDELRQLYWDEEMSQRDIAQALDTTLHHVSVAMREADIPLRSRSQVATLNNKRYHQPKKRRITAKGYAMLYMPEHPRASRAGKYVFEHIVVWEIEKGPLPKGWIIHHINGIKSDNRIENLVAMPRKGHHPWLILHVCQEHLRKAEKRIIELERRLQECQQK